MKCQMCKRHEMVPLGSGWVCPRCDLNQKEKKK